MHPGEVMPEKAIEYARRCSPWKSRTSSRVDHTDVLHVVLVAVSGFKHGGSQVEVRDEGIFLVQAEPVAPRLVDSQAPGLDEDGRHPVLLSAQKPLRHSQVLVDVGAGPQHDWPEPHRHLASKVIIYGSRRQQDELWDPQPRFRFPFQLLQGKDDAAGRLLRNGAAGDVVVHGNRQEYGSTAPNAAGEQVHIVNAPIKDLHLLAFHHFRKLARNFCLVPAICMNLDVRRLEKYLNE